MPRSSNKRERLLESADQLILQQGFTQTTLADIATGSGVPLGNVYYYFKTKEDIGRKVIESRRSRIHQLLQECSAADTPKARLLAFLDHPVATRNSLAKDGCPLGTLAYELSHGDSALREASSALIRDVLDWCTSQFEQLALAEPHTLSLQFFGQLQGMSLIANTLHDPDVITDTVAGIRRWIEGL